VSVHVYPRSAIAGDYARAAAGLALVLLPVAVVDTLPVVALLLTLAALIFAAFAARAVQRHLTRIECDDAGIVVRGPGAGTLPWRELDRLKVDFYATRRDRSDGWLELTLAAGRRRLKVDSRIAGFDDLARRAVAAARSNGVALDPRTLYNLSAIDRRTGQSGTRGDAG
jgi:hypothetical protein